MKERRERGERSGRKQREKMAYWGSDTENGVCQNKENIIHHNKQVLKKYTNLKLGLSVIATSTATD